MLFGAQRKGVRESVKALIRSLSPPSCRSVDNDASDEIIERKSRQRFDGG